MKNPELQQLSRSRDWKTTCLGSLDGWPLELQTIASAVLASPFPMIILWGSQLGQIYNDAYRPLLGRRHPEALGQPTAQCWPELWPFNEPIYRRALEGASTYLEDQPYEIESPQGVQPLFLTISYSPLRVASGSVGGILVTLLETTTRVLRERASTSLLERQAKTFDTVLSEIEDFAYIFDLEGRFVYVNRPLLNLWALSAEEAIGKNFHQLPYPPELAQRLHDQILTVAATATVLRDETVYTAPSGQTKHYEYIFTPVLDADGRVAQIAGSTRDVTHHKAVEQSLRDADQRKNDFLAVLAHELRNPLAPIRQAAKVAASEKATQAQIRWSHDVVERQVQHMTRLLEDLLDVSRIGLDRIELRRERLDLRQSLDMAMELVEPAIETRKQRILTDLPEAAVTFYADPVRFAQVIGNLLSNASKYSDAGAAIRLSAQVDENWLTISVIDSGVGIADDMRGRLFQMFSQSSDSLRRSEGGLGIGLALAKSLVELHGGTIRAESGGPGKGSRFAVRLPWRPADGQLANGPIPAPQPASDKLRILVVDDNEEAARSLATWLELDGHTVQAVFDGYQALESIATDMPDVVLLDIGLPGLNGYEVAERIRKSPKGDSVILVAQTGWGSDKDKQRAMTAGFDHHLTKPVDVERLEELWTAERRPV